MNNNEDDFESFNEVDSLYLEMQTDGYLQEALESVYSQLDEYN